MRDLRHNFHLTRLGIQDPYLIFLRKLIYRPTVESEFFAIGRNGEKPIRASRGRNEFLVLWIFGINGVNVRVPSIPLDEIEGIPVRTPRRIHPFEVQRNRSQILRAFDCRCIEIPIEATEIFIESVDCIRQVSCRCRFT